jgi:hypothetical protein
MELKFRLINSLIMSGILSLMMTCWVTFINLGSSADFFLHWMKAWSFAWPPALVISFVCGPVVMRLSQKLAKINQ